MFFPSAWRSCPSSSAPSVTLLPQSVLASAAHTLLPQSWVGGAPLPLYSQHLQPFPCLHTCLDHFILKIYFLRTTVLLKHHFTSLFIHHQTFENKRYPLTNYTIFSLPLILFLSDWNMMYTPCITPWKLLPKRWPMATTFGRPIAPLQPPCCIKQCCSLSGIQCNVLAASPFCHLWFQTLPLYRCSQVYSILSTSSSLIAAHYVYLFLTIKKKNNKIKNPHAQLNPSHSFPLFVYQLGWFWLQIIRG